MVMGGWVGRVGCEGRDMTWVCSELETKGRSKGLWGWEGYMCILHRACIVVLLLLLESQVTKEIHSVIKLVIR